MNKPQSKKQPLAIVAVVAMTVLLGAFILFYNKTPAGGDVHGPEKSATENHKNEVNANAVKEPAKGPHGGKLLKSGDYAVEVTIFEAGVQPQFRLYTYLNGKPLDPAQSQIQLDLERLGQAPQTFKFRKEADYLQGDALVVEPHSFKVKVTAVYAGQAHQLGYEQIEARVSMSDAQLTSSGIEIMTAGPARIVTTLRLLGEVKYNNDRTVQVVPRLAGLVEQVNANAGDIVRKGQVLAVLSSQGLSDQRVELLAAQRRLALARTTFERELKLWEEKISPEQDMLQAKSAMEEFAIAVRSAQNKLATLGGVPGGGSLTRYELRSPIGGVVTEKRLSLGETVKEDSAVFTVSDLSSVWVEAPVFPQDLGTIATGQPVVVNATAFEAKTSAKINYISALVGEQTRTATARINLANPKGIWRPGLPVTIEVLVEKKDVPVAVAVEAVQDLRHWKVVFGRYGTHLEARPLVLGRSDGKHIEVLEGLKAAEQYAGTNSFLVKAELGKSGASHGQ